MNYRIQFPIERIRGSQNLVVTLECYEIVSNQKYSVSSIATCSDDENSIEDAIDRAIEKGRKKLKDSRLKSGREIPIILNIIRKNIDTYRESITKKLKDTVLDSMIDQLDGPADELRQKHLNDLCEVLGFDTINILENWTMLEALALIEELKQEISGLGMT